MTIKKIKPKKESNRNQTIAKKYKGIYKCTKRYLSKQINNDYLIVSNGKFLG